MTTIIIPKRNVVIIDGEGYDVDCSALDQGIHVIELDVSRGIIEYVNSRHAGPGEYKPNKVIEDFAPYQPLIDAWRAAKIEASKPPPPNSMLSDFNMGRSIADFLNTPTGV